MIEKRIAPTSTQMWSYLGAANKLSYWAGGDGPTISNTGDISTKCIRYYNATVTTGTVYSYQWAVSAEL